MRVLRRSLKLVVILLAAVIMLLAGAWALVQTPVAKSMLAGLIGRLASSPGAEIGVEGIEGLLPFDTGVARVRLSDASGPWLEIEDARLTVRAKDLLQARLTIELLSARSVTLLRLPAPSSEPTKAESAPIAWPTSLPPIALDHLEIGAVALGAPVLGEPASFRVTGSARPNPTLDALHADLEIIRTDRADASLRLAADVDLAARTLALDLDVQETGGLMARLLERPDSGAARVALKGNGPLQGWRGRLDASVEKLGRLGGELVLAVEPAPSADLDLALELADGALPPDLAAPLGSRVTLTGRALQPSSGSIAVERLRLDVAAGRIEGQGTFIQAGRRITAKLHAELPDLAPFSALATIPLSGAAKLDLDVAGTAEAPQLSAVLNVASLAADQTRLATADLRATATVPSEGPIPFTLAGRLDRLAQPGLPQEIARIELDTAGVAGLEPRVRLDRLDVALPEQAATLTGPFGLAADGGLSGRLELKLADLSRLAPFAGLPLAGHAEASIEPAGSLDRPQAKFLVNGTELAQGDQKIGDLRLSADLGRDGEAMLASLRLDAGAAAAALALSGDLRLTTEQLRVTGLGLHGPQLEAGGDLDVALPSGLATGRIEVRSTDLSALRAYLPEPLQGSLDLLLVLSAQEGRQDIDGKLDARSLRGGFGSLGNLRLTAKGQDVLGKGGLTADLALEGFRRDELTIERATIAANGPTAELPLRIEAKGAQGDNPFDLAARGRVAALGSLRRIELESLKGRWAGQPIELMSPARITLDQAGGIDLSQLDLKLGAMRARTRASLGGGQVKAEARLDQVEIATFAAFGAPRLPGRVSANLTVSGSVAEPSAQLSLDLAGLRPPGRTQGPELSAALRAGLVAGRRLETRLDLRGLGAQPATMVVQLPLRLTIQPFAFALQQDAKLDGTLAGSIDLARAAGFLPLDGQQVAGRLTLDLGLTGSVGAPALTGRADLTGGRVTDAGTGLALRELTAALRTRDGKLIVDSLSGQDRGQGRITGKGEVTLTPLAFRIEASTKGLEVMRSELGRISITGNARVQGDGSATTVWSRLAIARAEIRIPDPAGSPPATIAVREVGRGAPPPKDEEPAAGPAAPIGLDVVLDVPQGTTFVRGRGLDSEWKGTVKVGGQAGSPDVTGKIEAVRGSLDFLGTRFALGTSEVIFDGAKPPMPRLDVLATAAKTDLTAKIHIVGRPPTPEVKFESDPVRPRDDILARILFDKDLSRISPFEAASLANALAQLDGGGIDAVGRLRDLTGLDTLGVGGGTESEDPSARAGKYITDKVYLEVQQGLTPESGKAKVEVDLGGNFKGTTEMRQTGQTGVGLQWQHDY